MGYSWEKRKDDLLMLLIRFGSLAIVAVAVEQISQTHSLSDVQDFVTSSYIDVLDWGVDKLTALPGSEKAALPSLEQLKKQEIDEDGADSNSSSRKVSKSDADNADDDDSEEEVINADEAAA